MTLVGMAPGKSRPQEVLDWPQMNSEGINIMSLALEAVFVFGQ